jgi:sulfonate transport system substrate-binding protein
LPQIRPSAVRTLSVAVLVIAATACGSSSQKAATSPSTIGAPAKAATVSSSGGSAIPAGTVLNVGDQEQLVETLFKDSGVESGIPYKINFVQFGSGPLVDSGFAAHRIDIGFMGDLPAALAAQSGLPVEAAAVDTGIGAEEFLIAKPGITTIAQLKGKSVAYTTGTAEQAFALRALATAGLKQQDVDQVNVALQQLFTVLEAGEVDASVISGVQEEKLYLQQHPTAKVLATNLTVSPASYDYELATTSALANPAKDAAIKDYVTRLIEASNWAYTHQSQYATDYLVDVEHETPAEAQLGVTGGLISDFVPITSTVQSALQNVVDLEAGAGAIKASYSVASLFNPTVSATYNQILKEVPQDAPTNG